MINILNGIFNVRDYFLVGRINRKIHNSESNLYKFFTAPNALFKEVQTAINSYYAGLYPCLSNSLIVEHERELGIPDNIFNSKNDHYEFTYKFPIIFGNSPIDSDESRLNDVIVKKYLMTDNSWNGFKRIAGQYGYSLSRDVNFSELTCGFTYNFPILFCEDDKNIVLSGECVGDIDNTQFTYKFPIRFVENNNLIGENCIETPYGQNGKPTSISTTIYVHGIGENINEFYKLKNIFELIAPMGENINIQISNDMHPYTPIKFCEKG